MSHDEFPLCVARNASRGGPPLSIALFGDSIAAGLGVLRKSYIEVLAELLRAEVSDYSFTGATVADSRQFFSRKPCTPDIAIIAHGITEPILRPDLTGVRFIPRRWMRRGWMDPRPYYSSRLHRRLIERVESGVRWRVKNLIMYVRGAQQLLGLHEYYDETVALVEELQSVGARVFIVGPPHIDERFFPGSARQQARYLSRLHGIPRVVFVDVQTRLRPWDDYLLDRFHPNDEGHVSIGYSLAEAIMQGGWK